MKTRIQSDILGFFIVIFFIAGCTFSKRTPTHFDLENTVWQGRIALQVDADPENQQPGQSFSSGFEVSGNAVQGEMLFTSPIGSTVAAISWSPAGATLKSSASTREFTDLTDLLRELLGTPVPVDALFEWLRGQNVDADGWQVDLSERRDGRIVATRLMPRPIARLRIILES